MEIQEKIEALRKEIEYHVERYYNQDDPEITDYEYDQKDLQIHPDRWKIRKHFLSEYSTQEENPEILL